MSEEDELLLGTIAGVDLILSPEHYKKYKGTLNKQIEELKFQLQQKENIIKEVREYIMSELITEWDIKNGGYVSGSDLPANAITPILEILDKDGGKNETNK